MSWLSFFEIHFESWWSWGAFVLLVTATALRIDLTRRIRRFDSYTNDLSPQVERAVTQHQQQNAKNISPTKNRDFVINQSLASAQVSVSDDVLEQRLILFRRIVTATAFVLFFVIFVTQSCLPMLLFSIKDNVSFRRLIALYGVHRWSWLGWSFFWGLLILVLVGYKVYAALRNQESQNVPQTKTVPKPQSVPAPQPQIAAPLKGFNMSMGGGKTRGGFQRQNQTERDSFFDRLGISAGFSFLRENKLIISLVIGSGILLAVLIYFGYKLMTMEWIDAEGYPTAKPWWLYLIPFLLLGCGILVYKIIGMIRENAAERSSRPAKFSPARTQQHSQKPTGFNRPSSGRGGFQHGFQQQTQQSPLRNLFSHPVTWIVIGVVGVLLFVIVLLLVFR